MNDTVNFESYLKEFFKYRKLDIVMLIAGAILGVIFGWSVLEIIIFLVFLWSFLGPISSRILIFPAIFFLAFTPFLLILKFNERAEEFSVYAYYFLVMAVIRGIIEVRKEKKDK